MSRTLARQPTQVGKTDTYVDTLPFGPTLETGAVNLQDDLNSLRSQIKRLMGPFAGSWTDEPVAFDPFAKAIITTEGGLMYNSAGDILVKS